MLIHPAVPDVLHKPPPAPPIGVLQRVQRPASRALSRAFPFSVSRPCFRKSFVRSRSLSGSSPSSRYSFTLWAPRCFVSPSLPSASASAPISFQPPGQTAPVPLLIFSFVASRRALAVMIWSSDP